MPFLFPLVLGALGMGVSFIFAGNKKQQVEQAWSAAAAELALTYSPGSGLTSFGTITGLLRGVTVHVDVKVRGNGDSRKEYTRCHLQYPSAATGSFIMSKQKAFSIFGQLFGRTDVQIGDPSFDSRVVIDAPDAVEIDRYLTPARRMAVTRLMESHAFVEIAPGSVTTELAGVERSAPNLKARLMHLLDIALVLGAPSDVDLALEKQQRGDLADAVVALHELNDVQDEDPNSFTQFLEAEALVAMGDGQAASQILDDLPVFDAELGEWRTVARSHPKPVELKPISPANLSARSEAEKPPTASVAETEVPLDQASIIADLFGSDRAGYEVEQRFFDAYESKTVEWSGTVRRSREFRSDRDFPGAGVKATVEIGSRGDSKLVSNQINAIVHLPEGTAVQLGDSITFRGTFVRTDRYMRNLFIANAEMV